MKRRCCLSTPGSPEEILCVAHSTSVTPVSPYTHCRSWTIHFEVVIERVWRCTVRPWSIEFGDALADLDWLNSEMHLEAGIERVWRCTWRPGSTALRDTLGGRDWVSLEIQLETEIEWTQRCTWRPWSSEFGGVLGGGRFGGRRDGSWDSIHRLTWNCGNVESSVQHPPRDEELAGSGSLSILGWCCTWCMLYLVSTHDYGMER
jgi:hypothetical protein